MVKPSRERQKKYKARLVSLDKKPATVFLSKKSHELLMREKALSGKSYSEIIDGALLKISKIDQVLDTRNADVETALAELRVQFDQLHNTMEEHGNFTQSADCQAAGLGPFGPLTGGENQYRTVLDHSHDVIFCYDIKKGRFAYISPSMLWNWKVASEKYRALSPEEVLTDLIHPDDQEKVIEHYFAFLKDDPAAAGRSLDYRSKVGKDEYGWFSITQKVIYDENNEVTAYVGNVRDITERKRAEEKLRALIDQLEERLKEYSLRLEEKNAALKVLLDHNQEEKAEIEENIMLNIKELIMPVVDQFKNCGSKNIQKHIDVLKSNLNRITSSFSVKMTSRYLNLSHQELQVANYVMQGKTTKEVSEIMGLSNRTIDFHRANIRKKTGLANRNKSLRSHLLSLE